MFIIAKCRQKHDCNSTLMESWISNSFSGNQEKQIKPAVYISRSHGMNASAINILHYEWVLAPVALQLSMLSCEGSFPGILARTDMWTNNGAATEPQLAVHILLATCLDVLKYHFIVIHLVLTSEIMVLKHETAHKLLDCQTARSNQA